MVLSFTQILIILGIILGYMLVKLFKRAFNISARAALSDMMALIGGVDPSRTEDLFEGLIIRLSEMKERDRKSTIGEMFAACLFWITLKLALRLTKDDISIELRARLREFTAYDGLFVSKYFRELNKALLFAVVLALIIRAFVVQAFKIPSSSMVPTLLIGDHLLVNKFIYGTRFSFIDGAILKLREPKRGDIIVFQYPREDGKVDTKTITIRIPFTDTVIYEFTYDRDVDYIKRVIGLPGDKLTIKEGVLYINEKQIECEDLGYLNIPRDSGDGERQVRQCMEDLGEIKHILIHSSVEGNTEFGPFTVPPGELFVMGDNRDESYDSRAWGTVPIENIRGKAFIIYFSRTPDNSVRLNRFGRRIK